MSAERDITQLFRGLQLLMAPDNRIYLFAIIGSVIVLILFYVVIPMIRKVSRRKESAAGLAMSFEDLDKMQGKGLLTEDELKRVRQSLAKRYLEEQTRSRARVDELMTVAAEALKKAPPSSAPASPPEQQNNGPV